MSQNANSSAKGSQPIADLGFLISQVGAHSQNYFGALVEPLGLRTSHVGVLRAIHAAQGPTQRELGNRLGIFASNLVRLIDELEQRGLVERLQRDSDRRSYKLRLTPEGERSISGIERAVQEHQKSICASLNSAERHELHRLLQKIAADRDLTPGVHPDLAKRRRWCEPEAQRPEQRPERSKQLGPVERRSRQL